MKNAESRGKLGNWAKLVKKRINKEEKKEKKHHWNSGELPLVYSNDTD